MVDNTHDLSVKQGATLQFQMELIKEGAAVSLADYEFEGSIKNSIYDESGYPFRFIKEGNVLNVFLDADVSASMDFDEGVYDIVTTVADGRKTRLLAGKVTISFGVTL